MISGAPLELTVDGGQIRGIRRGGFRYWWGVPFAAPPVGDLRWRAPQPVEPWEGVRHCDRRPPAATQSAPAEAPDLETSEDCLYLNVTAPDAAVPLAGWPLLLWIHGGGNGMGAASDLDDGAVFARHGIVVVQMQYRLGAFGFLNLADTVDASEVDAGCAGFLDQVAALAWVHAHASVFGADPDRITIYGESAGAKAVAALMGSPAAHGLFAQAISSSGGDSVATPAATADVAKRVLAHLNVPRSADDPMADLRALPAAEILAAQSQVCPPNQTVWVWRANLHPTVLPARPIDSIGAGSAAGVRALIGNNADEAVFFAQLWGAEHCLGPLPDVLGTVLAGQPLDRLIDLYSESRAIAGAPVDRTRAGLALMGDERYAIPTLRLAEAQSQHGTVFRYRLDVAPPNYPPEYAGGHTCDLPMAWQTPELQQSRPADAEGHRVASAFHEAMASFIRTGVPSAETLPKWPRFDTTSRATMVFGTRCEVRNDPRSVEREVWPDQWEYGTWWALPDE